MFPGNPILDLRKQVSFPRLGAEHWDLLIAVATGLTKFAPDNPRGWIHWAYALREQRKVAEARDVLLTAEKLHPRRYGESHQEAATRSFPRFHAGA